MSRRTLGDILEDRHNSFNAVRLLAAGAVFVSHAYLIAPIGQHRQPLGGTAFDLGQLAVNVFFVLSGLMLSRSFALKPQLGSFVAARLLRIFPGLLVCGAVVAWVIGPLSTNLSIADYFASPATWLYPLLVPFFFSEPGLPGIFQFGKEAGQVNIPLWTVKYELLAYLSFLSIPLLRIFGSRLAIAALVALFGALLIFSYRTHAFDQSLIGSLVRFGFCFWLGMLAYLYRSHIQLDWPLALCGVVLALWLSSTILGQVASITAFAYLGATLGGTHIPLLTRATAQTDISYGFYLYSFPIQQALLARFGVTLPLALLMSLAALLVTLIIAYLSWRWIERPALSLKRSMQWPALTPKPTPTAKPAN
ncbi:MAG TPA: acyltransferase [Devosia sp.]|jgi:peptidoglycan/LPS O-acetylase OafA/YrhL